MRRYVIITESGSDLSCETIGQQPVCVLPMHVTLGNADYPDGFISIEELCNYYDKTGKVPKTSAINPDEYRKAYEKIKAMHKDAIIIHISYSSEVSSSLQNSIIAGDDNKNIYHIDTLNVSVGLAIIILKTVELIKRNPDIMPDDLVSLVKAYSAKTRFSFVPGNLDYLRAGGRVSNAQYLGATILGLKPLIEVRDGKLFSGKKYRGNFKRVAQQMINDYFSKYNINKKKICLVYVLRLDESFKKDIEKQLRELKVKEIVWIKAGAIITSHSGPGGFGIAGFEHIK